MGAQTASAVDSGSFDPAGRTGLIGSACLVGLFLGVGMQLQQPDLLPHRMAIVGAAGGALLIVLSLGLLWRRCSVCGCWCACVLALAGMVLLGLCSTDLRARARLADPLDLSLEGELLSLEGTVASLPQRRDQGLSFRFKVESAGRVSDGRPVKVPAAIQLGWWRGWNGSDLNALPLEASRQPKAGQRWRFQARLRRVHGLMNPNSFDTELWFFEQGLRAQGSVRSAAQVPVRLADASFATPVETLRQSIRDAIEARLAEHPEAAVREAVGIVVALTIGDQPAIDREDWAVFRVTGVAHLMAISGMHITMLAWAAAWGVRWLWSRSTRLVLRCPSVRAGRRGAIVVAVGYALLAGWGVPAQRTVLMLALALGLQGRGLNWSAPLILLVAAGGVILLDPWALLQAGFWLSFAAVALLMLSAPAQGQPDRDGPDPVLKRLKTTATRELHAQWVATLGLAPLTLVLFRQISWVGLGANLIAIPLVTLVITPLALAGLVIPVCWELAAWGVAGLMVILRGLAQPDWASATVAAAPLWLGLIGALGGWLCVAPLPLRLRLLGLPLLLALADPPLPRPAQGEFELLAPEIGQGNAVLVRTARQELLYDTGPLYGRDSDAGGRVLLPLLQSLGIGRIDHLVLSHRDADHVGGAASLMEVMPVQTSSTSLEDGHTLRGVLPAHRPCRRGQSWQVDGVQMRFLHPRERDADRARLGQLKSNGLSCVLEIVSASGRRVWLAGDIEAEQELALIEAEGPALQGHRLDVLLAPHHGSRTSSTAEFLAMVHPRLVLVQAGFRNRYGHPAPEVMERYEAQGIPVLRSDRCGAMHWRSADATGWCEREAVRRYWHVRK
jgi:competence protein ComEC